MLTDMLNNYPTFATAFVAVIIVSSSAVFYKKRRLTSKEGHPLPPGPPASWFWENVVPTVNIGSRFVDWATEYGPVITLRQGSRIAIFIARVDAASETMEKEGSALADRPPMIAADELLSGRKRITLVGSGDRFRRLRKAIHTHLQPKAVDTYKISSLSKRGSSSLTFLMTQTAIKSMCIVLYHIDWRRRVPTAIVLRITYAKSGLASTDDPDFVGVREVVAHFIEGMRPGAYLVDRFPWLKFIPGYGRRLRSFHDSDLKFYRDQLGRVERAMSSSDDVNPSFSRTLLENVHDHQLSFDEMSFLAGTIFEAGADTTANGIITMLMAAACFPDAQARVQEESNMVVGMDRLPSWNDWDSLPQFHAFISESLRWRPVTPLGMAHRSTRDIIWRGYYIPAGTSVMGNQWAISRDPIAFPDPEKFDPQRWLDQNGQLRNDVNCFAFGFGRRVCPGMYLANRSLFIALAVLLWSFRIVERPDAPLDTTPDMDNIVAHLAPFEVDFVPRIEEGRLREMVVM